MNTKSPRIVAVPTNIITGFLGAGKTTAILHLLKQKPADERWAILVNEFGEIGVDGSILQGAHQENGVHIREVPGGCMCCTAGLPMQIALSQLLRRANPHRLLIEPTGLGHPLEVLQTLSADYNREILSIQKTLTLVDARNLADERYTNHATFRQQLEIADVVVANKADLYTANDHSNLQEYVAQRCRAGTDIMSTQYGRIGSELLQGPTVMLTELAEKQAGTHTDTQAEAQHNQSENAQPVEALLPESGYVSATNKGEGFQSIGWRFSPEKVFDRNRLHALLRGIDAERMKAVFITSEGVFAYNLTRDALTETELDDCAESRMEVICDEVDAAWESRLTQCIETATSTHSS